MRQPSNAIFYGENWIPANDPVMAEVCGTLYRLAVWAMISSQLEMGASKFILPLSATKN